MNDPAPPQKTGVSISALLVCSLVLLVGISGIAESMRLQSQAPPRVVLKTAAATPLAIVPDTPGPPPSNRPHKNAAASDGGYVVIQKGWPCGSSKNALSEITKWAVQKDTAEMARTMAITGSALLIPGTRVKILDTGFMSSKIRIIRMGDPADSGLSGKSSLYYGFAGQECWAPSEAVR